MQHDSVFFVGVDRVGVGGATDTRDEDGGANELANESAVGLLAETEGRGEMGLLLLLLEGRRKQGFRHGEGREMG